MCPAKKANSRDRVAPFPAFTCATRSIWKGFGLPVLEAMAYGTLVVTSAGTCMAEVTGEAGLLADPASPREIADRLAEAIGPAHDELARAGRKRAQTFTWDTCAAAHTEVYNALIGGVA